MAGALLCAGLAQAALGCGKGSTDPRYFGVVERPPGRRADTLYVNAGGDPQHLDPGKAADQTSSLLAMHLFEGLTSYHPLDFHPVQGVAERYDKSPDNRLFRFHLRESVWSDGQPVTAHDFEHALRRALSPRTGSRGANVLYALRNAEALHRGRLARLREGSPPLARGELVVRLGVDGPWALVRRALAPTFAPRAAGEPSREPVRVLASSLEPAGMEELGVRALDARTVELELEAPTAHLLELLGSTAAMPVRRDVVEPFDARGEPDRWVRPEHIVTNGPFELESWRFRYELTMRASRRYWARSDMKIARVVFLLVEDYQAAMSLYRAGELDLLGDALAIPSPYLPVVSPLLDFVRFPIASTYWYELNVKKKPLDDVRVRRALSLCIDRALLARTVLQGAQLPATHYVPDAVGAGYGEALARRRAEGRAPFPTPEEAFDPPRARALLAEAGYPVRATADGFEAQGFPPLELAYNTAESHRAIAIAVEDSVRRCLGVRLRMRSEEWKVLLRNVQEGRFDIARFGWTGDYDHPLSWLEPFTTSSPQNGTGFSDPSLDEALERAAQLSDPRASIDAYVDAEAKALEGMPRIPLFFSTRSTLVKPWVRGFSGNTRSLHLAHWLAIEPSPTLGPRGAPEVVFPARELPSPGVF
jgi:oligopeptide transport system substrate-binding protein